MTEERTPELAEYLTSVARRLSRGLGSLVRTAMQQMANLSLDRKTVFIQLPTNRW